MSPHTEHPIDKWIVLIDAIAVETRYLSDFRENIVEIVKPFEKMSWVLFGINRRGDVLF
jgi:pyrimidine operon attenuation protein/uracil phosphoribosyltransferase